jgi:hypothetical protein
VQYSRPLEHKNMNIPSLFTKFLQTIASALKRLTDIDKSLDNDTTKKEDNKDKKKDTNKRTTTPDTQDTPGKSNTPGTQGTPGGKGGNNRRGAKACSAYQKYRLIRDVLITRRNMITDFSGGYYSA